jgi:tape measure domain-containing protein
LADDIVIGIGANADALDTEVKTSADRAEAELQQIGKAGLGGLDQVVDKVASGLQRAATAASGLKPKGFEQLATDLAKAGGEVTKLATKFDELKKGGFDAPTKTLDKLSESSRRASDQLRDLVQRARDAGSTSTGLDTLAKGAERLATAADKLDDISFGKKLQQDAAASATALEKAGTAVDKLQTRLSKKEGAAELKRQKQEAAELERALAKSAAAAGQASSELSRVKSDGLAKARAEADKLAKSEERVAAGAKGAGDALAKVGAKGLPNLDTAIERISGALNRVKQSAAGLELIKAGQPERIANVATRLETASTAASKLASEFNELEAGGLDGAAADAERLAVQIVKVKAELSAAVEEARALGGGGSGLDRLANQADQLGVALQSIEGIQLGAKLRADFAKAEAELAKAEKSATELEETLTKTGSNVGLKKLAEQIVRLDAELAKAKQQFDKLTAAGPLLGKGETAARALAERIREISAKVQEAAAKFGQLGPKSQGALDAIKTRAQEAAAAVEKIKFNGDGVASGAGKASSAIGLLRTAFTALVAVNVTDWLRQVSIESVKLAADQSDLIARFEGLTGSGEAAAKTLKDLDGIADDYGISIQVLRESYSRFLPAVTQLTKDSGQQLAIFEALASGFKGLGGDTDRLRLAFAGVNQVLGDQKVQFQDLNQIFDNIPGTFALLVDELAKTEKFAGLTQGAFRELAKEGGILSTDVIPALAIALQDKLGATIAKTADGANANFARIGNAILDLKIALGEDLLPEVFRIIDAFDGIEGKESAFVEIASALAPLVDLLTTIGDLLSGNVEGALQGVSAAIVGIGVTAQKVFTGIVGAIEKLLGLEGVLTDKFKENIKFFEDLRDGLREAADESRRSSEEQVTASDRVKARQEALKGELVKVGEAAAGISTAFKDADKVAGSLAKTIGGIFGALEKTTAKATEAGNALSEAFNPDGLDDFLLKLRDGLPKLEDIGLEGGDSPFAPAAVGDFVERAKKQLGIGLSKADLPAPSVSAPSVGGGGGSKVSQQARAAVDAILAEGAALQSALANLSPAEAEAAIQVLRGVDEAARSGGLSAEDLNRKLRTLADSLARGGDAGKALASGLREGLPRSAQQQELDKAVGSAGEFGRQLDELRNRTAGAASGTQSLATGAAQAATQTAAAGAAAGQAAQGVGAAGSAAAAAAPQWVTLADGTRQLTNTLPAVGASAQAAGQAAAAGGQAAAAAAPQWVTLADGTRELTNTLPATGQAAGAAGQAAAASGQSAAAAAPEWRTLADGTRELSNTAPAAGTAVAGAGAAAASAGAGVAQANTIVDQFGNTLAVIPTAAEAAAGAVTKVAEASVTTAEAAKDGGERFKEAGDAIAAGGEAAGMGAAGMNEAATAAQQLSTNLDPLTGKLQTVAEVAANTSPINTLKTSLDEVAPSASAAAGAFEALRGPLEFLFEAQFGSLESAPSILDGLATSATSATEPVAALAAPLKESAAAVTEIAAATAAGESLDGLATSAEKTVEPVKALAAPSTELAASVKTIADSSTAASEGVEGIGKSLDDAKGPIESGGKALGEVASSSTKLGGSLGEIPGQIKDALGAFDELIGQQEKLRTSFDETIAKTGEVALKLGEVGKALGELESNVNRARAALDKLTDPAIIQSLNAVATALSSISTHANAAADGLERAARAANNMPEGL